MAAFADSDESLSTPTTDHTSNAPNCRSNMCVCVCVAVQVEILNKKLQKLDQAFVSLNAFL